ncbi:unnamed protein product, partial [marine sediment metagenome]
MNIDELENKSRDELMALAKEKGISSSDGLNKQDIIMLLIRSDIEQQGQVF